MNPTSTLSVLLSTHDSGVFDEACQNLADWLHHGGYLPDLSGIHPLSFPDSSWTISLDYEFNLWMLEHVDLTTDLPKARYYLGRLSS
jgi:hypothetical protein